MAFFTKQFETQHFNGSAFAFFREFKINIAFQDHKVLLVRFATCSTRLAAHSGCIFFQHKRESQFIN
jgi:hypothetical protein